MIELFVVFVFAAVGLTVMSVLLGVAKCFFFAMHGMFWLLRFVLFLPVMIVSFVAAAFFLLVKGIFLVGLVVVAMGLASLFMGRGGRRDRQRDAFDRLHTTLGRMESRMRRMESDPRVSGWERRPSRY